MADDLTDELATAQRILDRCDGNLADAITHAAFRATIAKVLRAHWPVGVANLDTPGHEHHPDRCCPDHGHHVIPHRDCILR